MICNFFSNILLKKLHLAVASGVSYGVFCAVLFPAGCLGWDLGLN